MDGTIGRASNHDISSDASDGLATSRAPGFLIRAPQARAQNFLTIAGSERTNKRLSITHEGVDLIETNQGDIALIDGYALGVKPESLLRAIESNDRQFLNSTHGHYSVVVIKRNGDIHGYCDRLGGRTLYWHSSIQHGLVIGSRWLQMPVVDHQWDASGVGEMLRYRWLSGSHTLTTGVSRLPIWHRVCFHNHGGTSLHATGQEIRWTNEPRLRTFSEQLNATRSALELSLEQIAASYSNVAILLSGGVDSSLLAALAKKSFSSCLLVTPVFPGRRNPELAKAKAFAKTLGLEHLVVPFDEGRVAQDFEMLTQMKGGQISFHELAVHQLFAAIPSEYRLVMLGDAGDLLFGYQGLLYTYKLFRYRQLIDLLPQRLLNCLTPIPNSRAARLASLRKESIIGTLVRILKINYSDEAMRVIDGICPAQLDDIYTHRCLADYVCNRTEVPDQSSMRRLLQHLVLQSMGANHSFENELSAALFGKHVFLPFFSEPVLNVSKSLADEHYFADTFSKPILRELGCEHYDRSLIYSQKLGFEVPYDAWLTTTLADHVEEVGRERDLFDGRLLDGLGIAKDYSLFWSLMSLQACNRFFSERAGASSDIAV